jgi:hypothetical protein
LISGRTWQQCKRPDNIQELIRQRAENSRFKKGRICYIDAPPLTDLQKDIIIGGLLGDGSISQPKINSFFIKSQSLERKEYLEWHSKILNPYSIEILDEIYSDEKLIGGKKGVIIERIKIDKKLVGHRTRTHQHPEFTELRKKWYPNGIKIVPKDIVLTPQSIAIWYFDDGSNCVKNRTAVLCTQCFTLDEADLLCQKLNKFNLMPKIIKAVSQYTGREMPMLKFSKQSYDNLIALVTPYCLWDCFKYKIEWRDKMPKYKVSNKKLTLEQVKEIISYKGKASQQKIANIFGVAQTTISAILTGKNWAK